MHIHNSLDLVNSLHLYPVFHLFRHHAGVINNDRAKILHSDCERMVLLFAEQPYSEPVMKLPAAKRQRVDALTFDLTRVHAAEAFDWTATPLEMLTMEVRV